MKILLSELALRGLSSQIAHVMADRPFECVSFEQAVASGRRDFDCAFVSRDVTGLSTKHELAPSLKACYQVLEESPHLRWVHIHSAGADRDVYVRLKAKGVQVATSSGANSEVVAQTALAGLLALSRKFPELVHAMHEKKWAPLLGSQLPPDLAGQTAMLVGWGPIAQRVAQFLSMLGLRLKVVRQQAHAGTSSHSAAGASLIEMLTYETLDAALPNTDWLLLMCPLTATTRGLIDARRLALLPQGAGTQRQHGRDHGHADCQQRGGREPHYPCHGCKWMHRHAHGDAESLPSARAFSGDAVSTHHRHGLLANHHRKWWRGTLHLHTRHWLAACVVHTE